MRIYYLYVKVHKVTGLKYLGQTSSKDPHKYIGSGTYWKKHLRKHGADYITIILEECLSHQELKDLGLYYSKLWNVVASDDWANLKEEAGDGGMHGYKKSAECLAKQSLRMKGENNPMFGKVSPFKGRTHDESTRAIISQKAQGRVPHNKGQKASAEFCAKISESHHDVSGSNNPMWGRQHSQETKRKISEKAKQRRLSEEDRQKLSSIRKGKPWSAARRAAHEKFLMNKKQG